MTARATVRGIMIKLIRPPEISKDNKHGDYCSFRPRSRDRDVQVVVATTRNCTEHRDVRHDRAESFQTARHKSAVLFYQRLAIMTAAPELDLSYASPSTLPSAFVNYGLARTFER